MGYVSFIGLKHLKPRRQGFYISVIALIAIFGVMLGAGTLLVVISVTKGFQNVFRDKFLGTNAHAVVQKIGLDFYEHKRVLKSVKGVSGVTAAAPFTLNRVMISAPLGLTGATLKGIVPKLTSRVLDINKYLKGVKLSALLPDKNGPGIARLPGLILGAELFKRLKVKVGDQVEVVSPMGTGGGSVAQPLRREMRIAGSFSAGMYEYDNQLAFVEIGESQKLLGNPGLVHGIEIKVQDVNKVSQVKGALEKALKYGPYYVKTWKEISEMLFRALSLQQALLTLLTALIMLVATFTIVCTLILMVLERSREIAILKAMGASDGGIMRIFILQGGVIGTIGTILGIGIGCLVCMLIQEFGFSLDPKVYFISKLPINLDPLVIVTVTLTALAMSLLSTLYPAWRASRVNPVEGLRYE